MAKDLGTRSTRNVIAAVAAFRWRLLYAATLNRRSETHQPNSSLRDKIRAQNATFSTGCDYIPLQSSPLGLSTDVSTDQRRARMKLRTAK
jgi:hypothetical protein